VTDPTTGPIFDACSVQGAQINLGRGNSQFNWFAGPPVEEDLQYLINLSTPGAFALFESRPPQRQVQLLMDSEIAAEMFRRFYHQQGLDRGFPLLVPLQVPRIHHLLTGLEPEAREAILDQFAKTLACQDNLADAHAHLAGWAQTAPMVAADLIARVHALPPGEAPRTGLRGAMDLLPGGAAFLLALPPDVGARLLIRLLPAPLPGMARPVSVASASDIDLLVGQMVALDAARTARLAAQRSQALVAWYLRRLRFPAAASLLAHLLAIASPEQRQALLGALPRFLGSALQAGTGAASPESSTDLQLPQSPTAVLWIDAMLALASYAGPALSRALNHRKGFFAAASRREVADARALWRAAHYTTRDRDYFRRQRNHLGKLAVLLVIALVITLALA